MGEVPLVSLARKPVPAGQEAGIDRGEGPADLTAAGIVAEFHPAAVYTQAQVKDYFRRIRAAAPDALLVVNFWNTFSDWAFRITRETALPAIVYHPVGSSHQLPPESLMEAAGVYYIHSVDDWTELESAPGGGRRRAKCWPKAGCCGSRTTPIWRLPGTRTWASRSSAPRPRNTAICSTAFGRTSNLSARRWSSSGPRCGWRRSPMRI